MGFLVKNRQVVTRPAVEVMRNPLPTRRYVVPTEVTALGRSRSSESPVTIPESAVTLNQNTQYMKMDGKLGKNPRKGAIGDALHAVLCGACHNIRLLLKKLRLLGADSGLILSESLAV